MVSQSMMAAVVEEDSESKDVQEIRKMCGSFSDDNSGCPSDKPL